jgi:hypothetical protein
MLKNALHIVRLLGGLPLLLLVNCSAPEAPIDPTWSDVYPILQGQCLHCHGANAEQDGAGWRFDFLDAASLCKAEPSDDLAAALDPSSSFLAAKALILADIVPASPGSRPKMPPEPGRLLEEWQRTTLERFIGKLNSVTVGVDPAMAVRGPVPADARSPRITLQYALLNGILTLDYVVSDENADPVIGELRVGDNLVAPIPSAGAGQAAFNLGGQRPGTPLQVSARLCDGWGIRLRGVADGLPTLPN